MTPPNEESDIRYAAIQEDAAAKLGYATGPGVLGPVARAWTVKLYRDDSTTPIVYEAVKHVFWTADNSVFVIAQYTDGPGQEAHHYIHWPRERFAWYRLARA